ncbi:hypothetical protein D3C80_2094730 [compost metagenome]
MSTQLAIAAGQRVTELQLAAQALMKDRLKQAGEESHGRLGLGGDGLKGIEQQKRGLALYRQPMPGTPALPDPRLARAGHSG